MWQVTPLAFMELRFVQGKPVARYDDAIPLHTESSRHPGKYTGPKKMNNLNKCSQVFSSGVNRASASSSLLFTSVRCSTNKVMGRHWTQMCKRA